MFKKVLFIGGGLIAVLVVIVIAVAVTGGGDETSSTGDENEPEAEVAEAARVSAQPYRVVQEKDLTFGSRSRVSVDIESASATTEEAILATMMQAAVDRHRTDWPHAVSIALWTDHASDSSARNGIDYADDGCGWGGTDCTDQLWSGLLKGDFPEDLEEWGKPTDDEIEEGQEARCRNDLQCWAQRHQIDATVSCEIQIEAMARYDHEWTDGFGESKFSRIRWKDQEVGSISYYGDKLKLQNGFGAWEKHSYWCHFDPATNAVEVSVHKG